MVKCNMRVTSGTLASVCPIQDVLLIQGWGGGGGIKKLWCCVDGDVKPKIFGF